MSSSDTTRPRRTWRTAVAVVVCVLLVGVLLIEFLPLERLRGGPLYAAVALVIAGAALEVVLTLAHLAGVLVKATERE